MPIVEQNENKASQKASDEATDVQIAASYATQIKFHKEEIEVWSLVSELSRYKMETSFNRLQETKNTLELTEIQAALTKPKAPAPKKPGTDTEANLA